MNQEDLEASARRIGQALAKASAGWAPSLFDSRRWSDSLLDWCMKDEAFKVQLFRFVDVFPSLKTDEQIARLAEEYFSGVVGSGGLLQAGLQAASSSKLAARLSAASLRKQIVRMAKTFIAGSSVPDAGPVLKRLWDGGRAFSVDLLGEATVSEREADAYRDRCLEALAQLGRMTAIWTAHPLLERDHVGALPRVNLSIKLSALSPLFDPIDPDGSYRRVAGRVRPLLDLARQLPAAITFDMEQAELKALTLSVFMRILSEEAYRQFPGAGIALQAYHRETARDVESLIDWVRRRGTPVTVRLVKGAYWDSDTVRYRQKGWPLPVWRHKGETDWHYEALTARLIAVPDLIRPCFGTHNLRSLAHARAVVEAAGLPAQACEFQMIFGMAEPLQQAVVDAGYRLRLYTPVGEFIPGMAYLVRRLLENTSNESFLRKEYVEAVSLDQLLAPPLPLSEPSLMDARESDDRAEAAVSRRFVNEPQADFSRREVREAMSAALELVRGTLGRSVGTLPSPAVQPAGPEFPVRNPAKPEQFVGLVRSMTPDQVRAAVQTAEREWTQWRTLSVRARTEVLRRAAAAMRRRRFELAAWEVLEVGKPWREADGDITEAIDFLEFYALDMERLDRSVALGQMPGEHNTLTYGPRGLVAVIAPWNFPLAIPTGMVSAALVTGNAVLFKPSERALVTGTLLAELLIEAGVPAGVLHCLPGGPDVGQALADDPDIHMIAFTGSQDVGLRLLARAARLVPGQRHVTHVVAEMGGKNAIIVDDTADLDEAIGGVVTSFTGYQGQKCSACSRVIVHEAVYEPFLSRLAEAVDSLPIGDPADPGMRMGPMIDERAAAKVRRYIEIGKQEARVIVERQVGLGGNFVGPAVFADVPPASRLAREEIFGPVLAVMRAKDMPAALALANNSAYALTGGLYSRSPVNLRLAQETFDVGNLYINRPITGALVGRQPFGGHRLSGIGRKAGGAGYLEQFLVARVSSENTLRRGFAPEE